MFTTRRLIHLLCLAALGTASFALNSQGAPLPPDTATEPLSEAEVGKIVALVYPGRDDIVHAEGSRMFNTVTDYTHGKSYRVVFRANPLGRRYCHRREANLYTKWNWDQTADAGQDRDQIRTNWEFDYVARTSGNGEICDAIREEAFIHIKELYSEKFRIEILDIALNQFEKFAAEMSDISHEFIQQRKTSGCLFDDVTKEMLQSIVYEVIDYREIKVSYSINYECALGEHEIAIWIDLKIRDRYMDRQHKEWEWYDYDMGAVIS